MDLREMVDQIDWYEENSSFVIVEGVDGQIFQRTTKTFFNSANGGPVTTSCVALHRAHCGHLIGAQGAHELAGKCEKCGGWVCFRCVARCTKCQVLLCPSCAKTREGSIFCSGCRRIERIKEFARRVHEKLAE